MTSTILSQAPTLRRQSKVPPYQQIEHYLLEAIGSGCLAAGAKLPPERELAEAFGVSRMTLRHAFATLEARGLVTRMIGRNGGTFIQEPKIACDLTMVAGFTEQLRRHGLEPGATVLSASEIPASSETAAALDIEEGAPVYDIVRVRLANDIPIALEQSYFPAHVFPGMLEEQLEGSLYTLLDTRYGQRPVRATESLEALIIDAQRAKLLHVPAGSAVIQIDRSAFAKSGCVVEYARDLFRSDRTRILVQSGLSDIL
ncbi:MAG: GntR family transcriptional regulator [Ferrimicrobium sp.]